MLTITVNTPDGEEVQAPARFEVCGRCHGRGVHDCFEGGFSMSDEFVNDEFLEDYFERRIYDVDCSECGGLRVVPVLDEARCTPEVIEWHHEDLQMRAEFEHAARMGY